MGGEVGGGGGALGVDVGGTKVAVGWVGGDRHVTHRREEPTPADDATALQDVIVRLCRKVAGSAAGGVGAPVGVGAAGLVDRDGVVRYSPNIPAWVERPVAAELAEALGVRVVVVNDANAAAWGEYRAGAAAHAETTAVMLTLGTGVGGGLILDDRLILGWKGFAGEFGHMVVGGGGTVAGGGDRGDLEYLASGSAIGRAARTAVEEGRLHLPMDEAEVTGRVVTDAALEGDAEAVAVLAEVGEWLGTGIVSLIAALDPEIVVVGGGAMGAGALLLEPARAAMRARLLGRGHRREPQIVAAALGVDAGIVGAALLASEWHD